MSVGGGRIEGIRELQLFAWHGSRKKNKTEEEEKTMAKLNY